MNEIQHTEPVTSGAVPPAPTSQPSPPQPTPPQPTPPQPAAGRPDDVWGVQRPAALGPQPASQTPQDDPFRGTGAGSSYGPSYGDGPHSGPTSLDRGFAALKKAPLHRDSSRGVIGGVAAGIAERLGVSVAAVRVAAVALALFFGTGVGAYLLLWALLPDERGTTHVEQGIKGGKGASLAVLGLGAVAALGLLATIFDGLGWLVPVAIAASVVYVVMRKKGRSSAHSHG